MLECQKYRKKPVVIEAIRYSGDNLAEVLAFTGKHPRFDEWFSSFDEYAAHVASDRQLFKILTLEGTMEASPGDWIIKGVKGEFYPCKPDIFEATYDPPLSTVTPAEVGGLVEKLRQCAVDPMWADHAEVPKQWLSEAAAALEAKEAELAAVKAERDDLEVLKNMYRDDTESAKARLAKALKALEPFADIAGEPWADESGWTDAACQNDRICDWFGPSDFRAARRALTGGQEDG